MAQKARKKVKAKVRKEAEKRRITENTEVLSIVLEQGTSRGHCFWRVLRNPRLWDLSTKRSLQKMIGSAGLPRRLKKNNQ